MTETPKSLQSMDRLLHDRGFRHESPKPVHITYAVNILPA